MIVKPQTDANQSSINTTTWKPGRLPSMSVAFKTLTTAGQLICMGWRPTATLSAGATALDVATDNDKIIVRCLVGTDTNFQIIVSTAGVDVTLDSGIAVADNTGYTFTITVAADGTSVLQSQNVLTGALTHVEIPTIVDLSAASLGVPFFGVQAIGAATEQIDLVRLRGSVWVSA